MKAVSIALIMLLVSLSLGAASPPAKLLMMNEEAALGLIRFPWQSLKYQIVFLPPRPGLRAMILSGERRIEVYARPEDDSSRISYDIAHELGHAIDFTYNTEETRRKWMVVRGIDPATPWFGCARCSDYRTPAGDFAETFATLLLGPGRFAGRIAPAPKTDQIPQLAPFFPNVSFNAR